MQAAGILTASLPCFATRVSLVGCVTASDLPLLPSICTAPLSCAACLQVFKKSKLTTATAVDSSGEETKRKKKRKVQDIGREVPQKHKKKKVPKSTPLPQDPDSDSDDAAILAEAEAEARAEGLIPADTAQSTHAEARKHKRLAELAERDAAKAARDSADQTLQVFFGRCPDTVTDGHIHEHYKGLGKGEAVKGIMWAAARTGVDRRDFKGWGIVTFTSTEFAMQAAAMKPPVVDGRELVVRWKGYSDLDTKRPAQMLAEMQKKRTDIDVGGGELWQNLWRKGRTVAAVTWTDQMMRERRFQRDFTGCIQRAERADGELAGWVEANKIDSPEGTVEPVLAFDEVDFGGAVNKLLSKRYTTPTPIQSLAWPVLLQGRDCIGLAQTGSGKTLAYALPAIVHLRAQARSVGAEGPVVLILAPTRELTMQIHDEVEKFQMAAGIRVAMAYGGQDGKADRLKQADIIMRGVDIICATPGRTIDFIEAGILKLGVCWGRWGWTGCGCGSVPPGTHPSFPGDHP